MNIALITPAGPRSRYGNRNTAVRWARMLRAHGYRVTVQESWNGRAADLLLALHARRSHDSISRYAERFPERPLIVTLTGTDLYRDIRTDVNAQESLELATHLIVLQDQGLRELPPRLRRKTSVVYQSCAPIARRPALDDCFEIIVSGHLRAEKDPFRAAAALQYLPRDSRIRLTHIGGARTPEFAATAQRWMQREPRYHWLGEVTQQRALALLARARVMVISSLMEGGANVVSETLIARTPVIASCIPGNRGLLGADYRGYFPVGNTRALARLLQKTETDPQFLTALRRQCALQRQRVTPACERRALLRIITAAARTKIV